MDLAEYLGCNQVPNSLVPFYEDALLKSFTRNNQSNVEILHEQGRQIVFKAENLLSTEHCKEILKSPLLEIFEKKFIFWNEVPLYKIQVKDKEFASGLWDAVHPLLKGLVDNTKLNCQPLGFDVGRGDWVLHDLNSTLKIQNATVCTKIDHLLPRKDAQFCASPDQRSVLTLLIFLNDGYEGGETSFYFPKDEAQYQADLRKGMTFKGEIEAAGGLENGYTCVRIKPKAGDAFFFSHDILHASSKVTSKARLVLKTEVIVERINKIPGIAIAEHENEDYLKCLSLLRSGISHEVNDNFEMGRECCERALAVRYSYPIDDESSNTRLRSQTLPRNDVDKDYILPDMIWCMIFNCMSGVDIENCVKAFPGLESVRRDWEMRRFLKDEKMSHESLLFIPEIGFKESEGLFTCFKFKDEFFFYENIDSCVRVAAMYSLALIGTSGQFYPNEYDPGPFYSVRYDPDAQEVHPLSLTSLLIDTFLDRPYHGSIYNVQQRGPDKKIQDDFHNSVDSCYMSLRHNSQFIGLPLCKQMSVQVEWPDVTEKNMAKFIWWESDNRGSSDWVQNCHFDIKYRSASPDRDYEVSHPYREPYDWEYEHKRTDLLLTYSRLCLKANDEILPKLYCEYSINRAIEVGGYPAVIKDILKYNALKDYYIEFPDFDVDWLNKMLTSTNIVVSVGNTLSSWWQHDACTRRSLDGELNASQIYLKKVLEIAEKKKGSSTALVSDIDCHSKVKDGKICLCEPPFGDSYQDLDDEFEFGGEGFHLFEGKTVAKPYNRLILDFSNHKLTVRKDKDNNTAIDKREHDCIFYNAFQTDFRRQNIDELTNVAIFTVTLDPIRGGNLGENQLEKETSEGMFTPKYDHYGRPCYCKVPGFKVTHYKNLLDYINLDHVHIMAGLKAGTHEVIVWAVHGGFNIA